MRSVDYDQRLHAVYAKGRAMPTATLQAWMSAFARHLPARRPLSLLDLGSGTGRLTPALAAAFGGPVAGVEPSLKMLAQARSGAAHPDVTYLAGAAESIPLPSASCDAAVVFWAAVVADFTMAGWSWVTLDEVETMTAVNKRADFGRLRTRALSTFEHMTEDEIEDGFAAIEAGLPEADDHPVITRGDLLVFER